MKAPVRKGSTARSSQIDSSLEQHRNDPVALQKLDEMNALLRKIGMVKKPKSLEGKAKA